MLVAAGRGAVQCAANAGCVSSLVQVPREAMCVSVCILKGKILGRAEVRWVGGV